MQQASDKSAATKKQGDPAGDLEDLMIGYQSGDAEAARALIGLISPRMHRSFLVHLGSRADADDLLQETWLRIHRVRHTYRHGEPVLPWFYAIARHVRVDHYRKAVRTTARERSLDQASTLAAPSCVDPLQTDGLDALLAPLPPSQREVIELLKIGGMSLEEAARATSSSIGSIKQKVHRAYRTIRTHLDAAKREKRRIGIEP